MVADERPFYDRGAELRWLRGLTRSPRPELVIVYGRRGVGKSRLLDEAFRHLPYFAYTADQRVLPQQLEDMANALNAMAPNVVTGALQATEDVLRLLSRLALRNHRRPFVAVIDELPYLASVDQGLLSVIQRWWNQQKRDSASNFKVFLAGSLVSWMQQQALAETAPLKSVRTGQLRVDPLTYRDAAHFYGRLSPQDRVRAWAVWGGLPAYLEQIDARRSFWRNLEETTLVPGARLFEEPDWLKYTDLRASTLYTSMVRAVASGKHRPSSIAVAVGKSSANEISTQLDNLREAGVIERRVPLLGGGDGPSQAAKYSLADNFLAYWYRFVDPHRSALRRGVRDSLLSALRSPGDRGLDKYVSAHAFEEVCRTFLYEALRERRLPRALQFDRVGAWWSTRGQRDESQESDEADVVAYARDRLVAIGECKWTHQPMSERDLAGVDKLVREAAAQLKPAGSVYRLLFSKRGFTPSLRERGRKASERILLFEPKDLYW